MKGNIILLAILLAPVLILAQSVKEEVELIQAIYGMEKKKVIAEYTGLTTDSGLLFWNIYDQYEDERKEIGQKRVSLIFNYVNNYNDLTSSQVDYLVSQTMNHRSQLNRLIKRYHKKIKKVTNAKTAAQFVQLELNFLDGTRSQIMKQLPKIGVHFN